MTAAPPAHRVIRECLLLLLIAAGPALLASFFHPQRPAWNWNRPGVIEVGLNEAVGWPPPVLWVDARAADAYQRQHIPGAALLNESAWDQLLPGFLAAWQPRAKVVVYCDSQACNASQGVATRLQRELALPDIYVLKGGWSTWQQAHP